MAEMGPKPGWAQIRDERRGQVDVEGHPVEVHDLDPGGRLVTPTKLADAALCYLSAAREQIRDTNRLMAAGARWPFPDGWNPADDPATNLVKARALIAAEIDRLARARREGR